MNFSRADQVFDGEQLARIRSELGPLDRLLLRKKDDLFAQWTTDEKLTRDFCAGALSVIDSIMADIDQLIETGRVLREEEADEEQSLKSQALDGGGHGDLAS